MGEKLVCSPKSFSHIIIFHAFHIIPIINIVSPFQVTTNMLLLNFNGINLHSENVNELGDNVMFMCGVTDEDEYEGPQRFEVFIDGTGNGGVPVQDAFWF